MRHLIATFAAAFLACLAANAQDWTGKVTDAEGMPLEAASVCLRSPADSSILAYALAEGSSFGNVYNEVFADGVFYDKLVNTVNETTPVDYNHSVNAYYHGRIGKVEVDFNADYTHSSPETVNHYLEHSTSYEDQDFTTTSRSTSDLAAAKLVLGYPLFGGQLSAGAEYTNTARKDDYITTGVLNGAANELYESNIGPFVEYSHALPFGQVLAGLRYEHVSFAYYEAGVRKDSQCRTFGNLFPSVNPGGSRFRSNTISTPPAASTAAPVPATTRRRDYSQKHIFFISL